MTKKILLLLFLPAFAAGQTFEEIAKALCQADQQAVLLFGENSKIVRLIESQPEMDGKMLFKCKYNSEIGKRLGVGSPTMYYFDKNMVALHKEELSSRGWKIFKKALDKPTSKDCLITALPEPKKASIPAEDRISLADNKPTSKPMPKQQAIPKAAQIEKKEQAKIPNLNEDLPPSNAAQFWTIQLGVYVKAENAERKVSQDREIIASSHLAYVPGIGKEAYVVTAGLFAEKSEAQRWAKKLGGFAIKASDVIN
jgi:hypothetical protein